MGMKTMMMISMFVAMAAEPVTFLGRGYKLGHTELKPNPMYEYVSGAETVQNWTTLLTLIDRADAKSLGDLDRLAQGVMDTYKARGGKMVMAKTLKDGAGKPLNYMIVAFDEPGKKRYELSFVKAAMGAKNAYIAVYGVRVSDDRDYVAKAKKFLSEHSGEIGMAMEKVAGPGK